VVSLEHVAHCGRLGAVTQQNAIYGRSWPVRCRFLGHEKREREKKMEGTLNATWLATWKVLVSGCRDHLSTGCMHPPRVVALVTSHFFLGLPLEIYLSDETRFPGQLADWDPWLANGGGQRLDALGGFLTSHQSRLAGVARAELDAVAPRVGAIARRQLSQSQRLPALGNKGFPWTRNRRHEIGGLSAFFCQHAWASGRAEVRWRPIAHFPLAGDVAGPC
jgi:hypothetical protein